MPTLHHICGQCDSEFTIKYNEENTEDSPHFCPFCGEMLIDTEDCSEEEY